MSALRNTIPISAAALLLALLISGAAFPVSAASPYTVALFPLLPAQPPPSPLERTATDVVSARLAGAPRIRLVDGNRLASIAAELGLKLSRGVSEEDARRIGSLAGAGIIITGQTSRVASDLVFAVRLIGVANSRVVERYVSGTSMGGIRPLLIELAETISRAVDEEGAGIVSGSAGPAEALSALKARLSGRDLPTLYVKMVESYGGLQRDASAGAEELERILSERGREQRSPPGGPGGERGPRRAAVCRPLPGRASVGGEHAPHRGGPLRVPRRKQGLPGCRSLPVGAFY
jgi:hypothetical protein